MTYIFTAMTEDHARAMLRWQYPPPYDLYNAAFAEADLAEEVAYLVQPDNAYFAIVNAGGTLIGHCCFGAEARVKGGDYAQDALDVGIGLRPDLTGQGNGATIAAAVLDFAAQQFNPTRYRATVAQFNMRAQRVCAAVGFQPQATFTRDDGRVFVVLVRPV